MTQGCLGEARSLQPRVLRAASCARRAGHRAALALGVAALLGAANVRAEVTVTLRLSESEVGSGETLRAEVSAMSDEGEAPEEPQLRVPDEIGVQGPRIGTRQQVSISGLNMVRQSGISASYRLTAPDRLGVYRIGPATVQHGGREYSSQSVELRVVEPRARRRGRRRADPFDPFDLQGPGNQLQDFFDQLQAPPRALFPPAPADLIPAALPDRVAFVAARLDPPEVVVGQQATLTIYAYGGRGLFQEAPGATEPAHADFLATPLVEDMGRSQGYEFELQGDHWIVAKAREVALFPLRAGELAVGPMRFGFLGRRYGNSPLGLLRETRPLTVRVSEPPAAGRPPGYAGDVGRFELSAEVQPARVAAGGSVSVVATVVGRGRLPASLKLPEASGLDWLEPSRQDSPQVDGTELGGKRVFTYILRLSKPGQTSLGELQLPFYDPLQRRYEVARANLGNVEVSSGDREPGGARSEPGKSEAPLDVAAIFPYRSQPQADWPRARNYLSDRAAYWGILGGTPLTLTALGGARHLALWSRKRRAERASSLGVQAEQQLRQARGQSDPAVVVTLAERALYLGLEERTGERLRAVLLGELASRLGRLGLDAADADLVVQLLQECERVRFGAAGTTPAELTQRAERVLHSLLQGGASRRPRVKRGAA